MVLPVGKLAVSRASFSKGDGAILAADPSYPDFSHKLVSLKYKLEDGTETAVRNEPGSAPSGQCRGCPKVSGQS